ncbi:ABC transporter [Streptomyces sp. NPDC049879]|uniref:ABC transporter n=1 Tax=Streptomyces sp. NPDC049879 TaxID=3365598 RepID=UPI0037A4E4D8
MPTVRGLLRAEARCLPWRLFAAAGGLGLALAVAAPLLTDAAGTRLALLRIAALCEAVGAAFVLDDPARHTARTLPVGRTVRQAVRLAAVLPCAALWWAACAAAGRAAHPVALSVEAAALVALAVVLAAGGVRFSGAEEPGTAAAGLLLALFTVAMLLPEGRTPFVGPEDPRWTAVHRGWAVLLVAATAAWPALAREPLRSAHQPRRLTCRWPSRGKSGGDAGRTASSA